MKNFFYTFVICAFFGLIWGAVGAGGVNLIPAAQAATQAATEDYVVRNISVDVVDQSSVKARDIAFAKAQEKAFQVLAQRYGRGDSSKPPSPQTLSTMIENFEIESEQNSRKRYRGVYTFRFRPSSVIGYFGGSLNGAYSNVDGAYPPDQSNQINGQINGGPAHGPDRSPGPYDGVRIEEHKILLIPYTQIGKDWALWDTKNNQFWVQLKDRLARESGDDPFILPQGTISDSTDIWEKSPTVLTSVSIKRIQARYGVDEVMIAAARAANNGLVVDLYRTVNGRVELIGQVPIRVSVLDRDQSGHQKAAEQIITLAKQDWQISSVQSARVEERAPQTEDVHMGADMGADVGEQNTQQDHQKIISLRPAIQSSPVAARLSAGAMTGGGAAAGSARFTYNYRSFAEWTRLQQFLKSSPAVASYSIKSLKTNGASVDISYRNWQDFMRECSQRGYHIRAVSQASYQGSNSSGYEIY